jgi:hypothetical protein
MIPANLNDWNYDIIQKLGDNNITESDRHDFKAKLSKSDSIPKKSLPKIVSSFANSKGGFILFGIKEIGNSFIIEGLKRDKEISKKFGDQLKRIEPSVYFESPKDIEIPNSNKVIYIFYIPLSPERPHITMNDNTPIFYKRTNSGCELMSYNEIKVEFQRLEERREKIKLLFIELVSAKHTLEIVKGIHTDAPIKAFSPITLEMNTLNSLLTDLYNLYTIIGKETKLVQLLITIRLQVTIFNNSTRMFLNRITFLNEYNTELLHGQHRQYINAVIDDSLIPPIDESIKILEDKFNLTNPFENHSENIQKPSP